MDESEPHSDGVPPMPVVRACIFDVDGLLINSEDIYTEAMNNLLHEYGKPDLPWSIKARQQSRGRPGAMAVIKWAQLPITIDQWSTEISAQMELMRKCKLLPGVPKLLSTLAKCQDPKLHLAIASSAGRSLFDIKTSNFSEVFDVIPQHCRFFGNDPEMQGKGKKPAPDVFLLALSRINESLGKDEEKVLPEQCLVFEDSTAGVEAGRRARMQVVWVPHPGLLGVYEGREDVVLEGTTDEYHEQLVNYEDAANGQLTNEHNGGSEHRQSITSSKDGRAKMLNSLEDFPYAEYGIKV